VAQLVHQIGFSGGGKGLKMHATDCRAVGGHFLPDQNFPPIHRTKDSTMLITMQVTMGK
jgi:hypothetical protein